ncbi:hypothetical protein D5018_20600 [Parashewanella curva]|uniref:Uncharacterized protein n=1 Tax=Parashewanella curva TaxID=2338552 RepID=A0A3L8PSL3_9GAMM|nr:hypothetical protein [Parashewanella curva]RLV57809.1 hypothetical protein D5018_20600 [Parashewanella curva]
MEFIKDVLTFLIDAVPFVIVTGLLYFGFKQYPRLTKGFLLTAITCFILGGISVGYVQDHSASKKTIQNATK